MIAIDDGRMPFDESSGVRVVVVDDARCFRETACELLMRRGYLVVSEADCAAGARQAVADLAPDAMLLDVNLPDGNGIELAGQLVQSDPGLAILLVSARCLDVRLLQNNAARGFVEKSELAKVDLARFWPAP